MITKNNTFSGASYSYENESKTCTASGEYRTENGTLSNININGQLAKDGATYNFWAVRDAQGNVNISGVPATVIADVAAEVAEIVAEVEAEIND